MDEDIACAVAFLIREDFDYLTGETLIVYKSTTVFPVFKKEHPLMDALFGLKESISSWMINKG